MASLVWYLISPGGLLVALLIGVFWLLRRPASQGPRGYLLLLTALYGIASVYAVSYNAGRLLVAGYRPFAASDVPRGKTALVVLGSGSMTAEDWEENRYSVVDLHAARRVLERYLVYKLVDPDWVISSGGSADPTEESVPTGITMRDALLQLGVPPARLLMETQSRDTHDEAVVVVPMVKSLGVAHTIIVTSDLHMWRSIAAFRAQGLEAVPAIARHDDPAMTLLPSLLPSAKGLQEASLVVHELLGLSYYSARGWARLAR